MDENAGSLVSKNICDRCPECEMALLNTPTILVRRTKRTRVNLPLKVCRHCKIIIIKGRTRMNEWKLWNNGEYIDLD